MADTDFVELVLTCGSWQEAQRIADALLEQKLVKGVEFMPIKSKHWWKQQLEEAEEVKLIMQSVAENFAKIEAVIKRLHRYETPNLHAVAVGDSTNQAAQWLHEQLEA
jgi:periplasmic divalent cation tolerance protein